METTRSSGAQDVRERKRRLRWFFGLQWQITAAVALGLVALFSAFAAIAYTTINQSTRAALQERLATATHSAQTIDDLVRRATWQMQHAAALTSVRQAGPGEVGAVLSDLRDVMATVEELALVDLDAGQVWVSPPAELDKARSWLADGNVLAAWETRVFQVTKAPGRGAVHSALAVIAVPVVPFDGSGQRVLVGEIHLGGEDQRLITLPQHSKTSAATIISDTGQVITSSNGEMPEKTYTHFGLLSGYMDRREAGVAVHHPTDGKSHVVAFAPFQTIPGGVIVEDREDVVMAVPQRLRQNLVLFSFLGLALTSGVAWLHAWRTMGPIRRLTGASQAIASGVLDQPVQVSRNDEIGLLARSFDAMREQLREAACQRALWGQQMEQRVKERTEQVHTLLGRVISAQEEERTRVARELHDQVAQDLATLSITLQQLARGASGLAAADRADLERAQRHLQATLAEMRRLIADLRPSALDDLGLEAAIRGYAEARAEAAALRVRFETSGASHEMDGPRETALFRIVQEAVNNAVRHAEANHLDIRLGFSTEGVEAVVQDDGKGFDVTSMTGNGDSASHVGLLGMRERAMLLGGVVEIESAPGRGTRVRTWLPTAT